MLLEHEDHRQKEEMMMESPSSSSSSKKPISSSHQANESGSENDMECEEEVQCLRDALPSSTASMKNGSDNKGENESGTEEEVQYLGVSQASARNPITSMQQGIEDNSNESESDTEEVQCLGVAPRSSRRNRFPTKIFDPASYIDSKSKSAEEVETSKKYCRDFIDKSAGQHPAPDKDGIMLVERILGRRRDVKGDFRYHIRWKGYGPNHDSWEPYENLNEYAQNYVRLRYVFKARNPDKILQSEISLEQCMAVLEHFDVTRKATSKRNSIYRKRGLGLPDFLTGIDENEEELNNQGREEYNDPFDRDYDPEAEDEEDDDSINEELDNIDIDNLDLIEDDLDFVKNDVLVMTTDNDYENCVPAATPFLPPETYPPHGGKYLTCDMRRGKRIATPSTCSVSSSNNSSTRTYFRYPPKSPCAPHEQEDRTSNSNIVTPPGRGKRLIIRPGSKSIDKKAFISNNLTKKMRGLSDRKGTSKRKKTPFNRRNPNLTATGYGASVTSKRTAVRMNQHGFQPEYNKDFDMKLIELLSQIEQQSPEELQQAGISEQKMYIVKGTLNMLRDIYSTNRSTSPSASLQRMINHDHDDMDYEAQDEEVKDNDRQHKSNNRYKTGEDENCRLSSSHRYDEIEIMIEPNSSKGTGFIDNKEVANGSSYLTRDMDDCEGSELSEVEDDDEDGYVTQDESERASVQFVSHSESSIAYSDHHSVVSFAAQDVGF